MFFATQGQRQIDNLKKRRLKSILQYNLSQIHRKQSLRQDEHNKLHGNVLTANQEALKVLIDQNKREEMRRIHQQMMLKESYQRAIREKEEKKKIEIINKREFQKKQLDHLAYEEGRRMLDLSRIYNRVTYKATPYEQHRRIRTEVQSDSVPFNNYSSRKMQFPDFKQPTFGPQSAKRPGAFYNPQKHNDSLDNLNAQAISYQSRPMRQ